MVVGWVFKGFDWWIYRFSVMVGGEETLSWLLASGFGLFSS